MQTTVKGSLRVGFNRLKGTLVGGIIGFLFVLIHPGSPFLACIGIITTIYICNIFKINDSITIACVVYCAILLCIGENNPLQYSLFRTWDTSIGVIMGLIINYVMARPNYYNNTMNEFIKIKELFKENVRNIVVDKNDLDLKSIEIKIKNSEAIYSKLIDEINYSKIDCNLDVIDKSLDLCRQIYFHIKSIELLEKELFLTKENHKQLKKLYKNEEKFIEINDDESPVFNFHLNKILEKIKILDDLVDVNN